jgi:putative solute:sodium symporter small subunit
MAPRGAADSIPGEQTAPTLTERILMNDRSALEVSDFHFASRRVLMADLTEEQKKSYWRYNITLTTILLVVWFVVTYLISGLWAGWLNQFSFLGFPLGYYMAAQGSLAIFVLEIAIYAYLMNKLDLEYGIREEG